MNFVSQHKSWVAVVVLALILVFVAVQFAVVKYNGTNVPAPSIPREALTLGIGTALNYVVLGDSTAVAQGAEYNQGVAVGTTQHLAEGSTVTMTNFGESGARTADVAQKQVRQIVGKPDLVLVLVGSNDVTHLTSKGSVNNSLRTIYDELVKRNCDVKIVVTGSAQMGAVDRFAQPLRWIAGVRSNQLNQTYAAFSNQHQLTFAELAQKTGQAFREDSSLFAPDKFHPNADGYAVWTPVLNSALDTALATQPSHCAKD